MAMSQTLGKIVFGRIADHPRVNRVYLYQLCLLVCSVLTTLLPIFTTYRSLLAYCLVFGFHDGCFVVLIAVLTGDIVGRKMMGTAYGVMFFFTGMPMMLGPPVASEYFSWHLVQSTATNPFTPNISLLILLTVCHTIPMMLVLRTWYWINLLSFLCFCFPMRPLRTRNFQESFVFSQCSNDKETLRK